MKFRTDYGSGKDATAPLAATPQRPARAGWAAGQPMGNVCNGDWFNQRASELLARLLNAAALDGRDVMTVYQWSQNPADPEPAAILNWLGPPDGAPSSKDSAPPEPGKPSTPHQPGTARPTARPAHPMAGVG